jgi:hypothetical protein
MKNNSTSTSSSELTYAKAMFLTTVRAGSPASQYWKEEILSFRPLGVDLSDWVRDNIEPLQKALPKTFDFELIRLKKIAEFNNKLDMLDEIQVRMSKGESLTKRQLAFIYKLSA